MSAPKLVIFDLDGTLYRGSEPTPGAIETVDELIRQGVQVRYLTNNSSQHRDALLLKLRTMGFPAEPGEIYSSAIGCARTLAEEGVKQVAVMGEMGLIATLEEHGVRVDGGRPEAVVVGICRHLTYADLDGALQHLLRGAAFVATNRDATYPLEGGRLQPGAGAMVAALEAACGRSPRVIGKPEPLLIRLILEEAGRRPEDALVVGDRIDTDLEAGRRAGVPTHLVLCGVACDPPEGQGCSADVRGVLDRLT